jgi:hypothetical protein
VAIRQQETGGAVVEVGVRPSVKRVTRRAVGGGKCSSGRRVNRVGSLLPIRQMARRAGRRESQVISDGGIFMALLALHDGVRAEQRKSVEVLLNRLDGNLPAKDRVALRAIRAELCAVNVSMAIGALFSNVGEHWFAVASGAGNFFVHAAKRVPRGIVIEFRNRPNGGPTRVGVAILAGNVQGSVRTSTRLPLSLRRATEGKDQKQEHEPTSDLSCA